MSVSEERANPLIRAGGIACMALCADKLDAMELLKFLELLKLVVIGCLGLVALWFMADWSQWPTGIR